MRNIGSYLFCRTRYLAKCLSRTCQIQCGLVIHLIFEVDGIDIFEFNLRIDVVFTAFGVFHTLGEARITIELCVGLYTIIL